jgi:hypothetical protein
LQKSEEVLKQHGSRFAFIQPILLQLPNHFVEFSNLVKKADALTHQPLARQVEDPWIQAVNNAHGTSAATFPNVANLRGSSAAPMPDITDPDGSDFVVRLNTIEHALKSLEKRTVGEGTKIGQFLFQSKEDLRLWMSTHVPNNRFGLFLDAVSIFDFLAQPHLDAQENMSQLYNSQKNGFETTYESFIVSSMQNLFPNLFGKSSADGMDTAKALPGLQTVDKWNNNGVTGLYLQVERELPNVDLQFRNAIASTFDDYPEARDLSLELLYRSKKFALDLCNFIQRDFDFLSNNRATGMRKPGNSLV